jgi:hypothetical protein
VGYAAPVFAIGTGLQHHRSCPVGDPHRQLCRQIVKLDKIIEIAVDASRPIARIKIRGRSAQTKDMIIRIIAILAAAFLFTGCGKKTEPSPSVPNPVAVQPAPASTVPEVSTPAAPSTATNANVQVDFEDLYYAVHAWMREHGRAPKDFEEFISTSGIQLPPPTPGKKYAFDGTYHVIVVNR